MKRVTVYDVAKDLGISTSTVSRVLNNSILIGAEKRDLILAAARRLGYRKRPIKRQKRRTILNITLFLPAGRGASTHLFYNPGDLIAGLYDGFGGVRANIVVKLAGVGDELFGTKKLGDIDGCVFAFSEPEEDVYLSFEERGIPVLELNRINENRNYVSCDDARGMAVLLQRLAGARGSDARPCYLGFSGIPAVDLRRRGGFLSAAAAMGLPAGLGDVHTLDALDEITPGFLSGLLRKGYNAALCFNDVVAVYFYQAAAMEGIRIPEDLSLTGFDDSPVLELVGRRIDTVSLSVRRLGMEAGAWLRGRIIDREESGIRKLIAGEYVPGETISPDRGVGRGRKRNES